MDAATIVVVVGVMFEAAAIVIGAVWAVGRIRTSTEVLSASLGAVRKTLEKVEQAVERIDGKADSLAERVAVIETKQEGQDG